MKALAVLVFLLPLMAAAITGLRILSGHHRGDVTERATARLSLGAAALSFVTLVTLDAHAIWFGVPGHVRLGEWWASGAVQVPFSLTLDRLSLSIATLFSALGFLALRFSVPYLHRETGFHRFFFIMNLFLAGMLLVILAGNAVLAFCGWELAGVSSYLLIGYAYDRSTASNNAVRAFVTNRIGDAGFILGIALAFSWLGSSEWPAITRPGQLETVLAGLLAMGFVVAALTKSALFPFSAWITRALEGPTPSSAIFYGSLLVHAGVYLIIRLEPLLVQAPAVMALLAVLGVITVVYGFLAGLTQTDVKSSLIFSVVTQVGLMFLACGLGAFTFAAWHMAVHAVWRAYQFLSAPSYLEFAEQPARTAPAWLTRRITFYTASLERLWLEPMTDWLTIRPTRALARDARDLDDRVISRLVGHPEEAGAAIPVRDRQDDFILGRGVAGGLLGWLAERLNRLEQRLLLQEGGALTARLRELGKVLATVETLLERPRYLLLMIALTFVVIL